MPAIHFTDQDFDQKVLKSDKPVLVDFYAPWCGPCRLAAPVIDSLADKYQDKVVIGKVNIDQDQKYAEQFCVMSVPTIIVYKKGQEVERQVGFPGEQGFIDMIEKQLGK
jgi:thioredoxin 1